MTYKITLTRSVVSASLATGVALGAVRFSLLKASDNSEVVKFDDSSAPLFHDFTGVEDESLIGSVQDLDEGGNFLGTAKLTEAFTPSEVVAAAAAAAAAGAASSTYAATDTVSFAVAAE